VQGVNVLAGKKDRAKATQKGHPAQRKRKPKTKAGWRKRFLAALRDSGIVRTACKAAKVDRTWAYRARSEDTAFAKQWDDAMEDACDLLEQEAWRRAHEGVDRGVYWQGKRVDTMREYSDGLIQFLLKGHRPSVFRENFRVEHSGPGGKPIEMRDVSGITDTELELIATGRGTGTARPPKGAPKPD